jgi:hypothetical protein
MKILYVGAGLHLQPLETFKECKEFIFIEALPYFNDPYYERKLYDKRFIKSLLSEIDKYGFKMVDENILSNEWIEMSCFSANPKLSEDIQDIKYKNPTCLTFRNEDQILKYYVSCGIPEYSNKIDIIQKEMSECDTLILCGYYPTKKIIKYLPSKINLVYYITPFLSNKIEEWKRHRLDILSHIINNPEMVLSERLIKYMD